MWWPRRGTQDGHAEALAQSITERWWSRGTSGRPSVVPRRGNLEILPGRAGVIPTRRSEATCGRPSAQAHRTVDVRGHRLLPRPRPARTWPSRRPSRGPCRSGAAVGAALGAPTAPRRAGGPTARPSARRARRRPPRRPRGPGHAAAVGSLTSSRRPSIRAGSPPATTAAPTTSPADRDVVQRDLQAEPRHDARRAARRPVGPGARLRGPHRAVVDAGLAQHGAHPVEALRRLGAAPLGVDRARLGAQVGDRDVRHGLAPRRPRDGHPAARPASAAVLVVAAGARAQAWPSKSDVTEPSSKTSRIARAMQRRDRQHRQLREAAVLGDRQRVGDDDLAGAALLQAVDRGVGQHAVRRGDDDVLGAGLEEHAHGPGDRAGGVDEVVDEHAACGPRRHRRRGWRPSCWGCGCRASCARTPAGRRPAWRPTARRRGCGRRPGETTVTFDGVDAACARTR